MFPFLITIRRLSIRTCRHRIYEIIYTILYILCMYYTYKLYNIYIYNIIYICPPS